MITYKDLNRSAIYLRHTKPGDSGIYVLMLNVDRFGATYMEFTRGHSRMHENIDNIYFEDIRCYASIYRIRYVPWINIPSKNYEFYRKISDREMRKITTVMKELFDGDIVCNYGRLCYKDEINEETTFAKKSKEDESESNIFNVKIEIDATSEIDNEVSEDAISTKEDISEIVSDNDTYCINNDVEMATINTEVFDTNNDDLNMCDTASEKYIDLLKNIPTTDDEFRDRKSKKNKTIIGKKGIKKEYKRYFSESDALSIAHMRNIAICEKYGVDSHIASVMKKNALEYFGMEGDTRECFKKTNYFKLFDAGYTLEQVLELYPINKSTAIKQSYNRWKSKDSSTIDYKKKFNQIVESDDLNELIKLSDMKIYEVVDYLQCPSQYANMISVKVRRILSKKSIFFPVFGTKVFNSEEFDKYISCARQGYSKSSIVTALNYDTCVRLQDIYNRTFDQHQDIIIGSDAVPNDIQSDDVCKFISIIKRTFTKKIKLDHIHDIDTIIENNDRMEYATRTMTEYNRASYIKKSNSK